MTRSLEELAAEINTAHDACQSAMTEGLRYALQAGEALHEAKARIPHGDWLPWLRANCTMSERTAQTYMRVTRAHLANPQRVAHLALRAALAELAAPGTGARSDGPAWGDEAWTIWEDPVSLLDVAAGTLPLKLAYRAGLPAPVGGYLSLLEYDPRALRLCPTDELSPALAQMYAIAKGETPVPFDTAGLGVTQTMGLAATVKIDAQRLCVCLFDELEARARRSYKQDAQECERIAANIMARIDERLCALTGDRDR